MVCSRHLLITFSNYEFHQSHLTHIKINPYNYGNDKKIKINNFVNIPVLDWINAKTNKTVFLANVKKKSLRDHLGK